MKIGKEINFQSWTFPDSFFFLNVSPYAIVHCPLSYYLVSTLREEITSNASKCEFNKMTKMAYYWYCLDMSVNIYILMLKLGSNLHPLRRKLEKSFN